MSIQFKRAFLLGTSAVVGLSCLPQSALAQTQLPAVEVTAPSPIVRRKPVPARTAHTHVTRPAPNRNAAPVPVEAPDDRPTGGARREAGAGDAGF